MAIRIRKKKRKRGPYRNKPPRRLKLRGIGHKSSGGAGSGGSGSAGPAGTVVGDGVGSAPPDYTGPGGTKPPKGQKPKNPPTSPQGTPATPGGPNAASPDYTGPAGTKGGGKGGKKDKGVVAHGTDGRWKGAGLITTTTTTTTTTTIPAPPPGYDPLNMDTEYLTLSGDNLIVSGGDGATWKGAKGNIGHSAGKKYFEILAYSMGSYGVIGVAAEGYSNNLHPGQSGAGGWGYMRNARFYNEGSYFYPTGSTQTISNGDIVSVAVDFSLGYMWWGKNGVWGTVGTIGVPDAGTFPHYNNLSGELFPMSGLRSIFNEQRIRLTSAQQTYPVPSGFTAWGD